MTRPSPVFAIVPLALVSTSSLACGDDTDRTEGDILSASALFVPSELDSCSVEGGRALVVAVNTPFTFRVRATTMTSTCECANTTEGCLGQRRCMREYDVGGPNKNECTTSDPVPLAVTEAVVEDDAWCTSETRIVDEDASIVDVVARCNAPLGLHFVVVRVTTERGVAENRMPLLVTKDGECPPAG
jgi:hypothetical protein